MNLHTCVSAKKSAFLFGSENLLRQLISVLAAWSMLMNTLPVYASEQPRPEWVKSWKFEAVRPPLAKAPAASAAKRSATQATPAPARSSSAMIAGLHPVNLPAGQKTSNALLSWPVIGLFALPLQATGDPQVQVSVGYADSTSSSANFPSPWNNQNPLVNFVGG